MKNLLPLLFILCTIFNISAQEEISITIDKATYKSKEAFISLDLTFKNNTDQTLYVLRPKASFFVNHYDTDNKLQYHGLDSAPFSLDISSNRRCKTSENDYIQIALEGYQIRLLSELIELEPNTSESFKNINIERYDGVFCKNRSFSLKLTYTPDFFIMDNASLKEIKEKYAFIKKETDELNRILYHKASNYRSVEKDNFKKLSSLFGNLKKMKALNGKTFSSNTIIATELK